MSAMTPVISRPGRRTRLEMPPRPDGRQRERANRKAQLACFDHRMSLRSCELLVAADRPTARRANHFVFSEMACPAPFAKIFRFAPDPNHFYINHCPAPQRGVAHVTNAGRDAVDAGS